jgi:hypothetical protein
MENNRIDLETPAISVLAAASKTPFTTALKVTLGIGLGRLILFGGFVLVVVSAVKAFT